ncbi:MAG: aminopeptidase [Armatimonadetes bacterium]|nr:aminopeptidase [Armatimonadota bacterium]
MGKRRRLLLILALPVVLLTLCGSHPMGRYLLKQGAGQMRIYLFRRPCGKVLETPGLSSSSREKILLIRDIKHFAENMLGLDRSDNYESHYDTQGGAAVFLLFAAPKDRLAPVLWKFPFLGEFPYKGFFSERDARVEEKGFLDQGYDTELMPVSAYSTLGLFPDPIFSPMLVWDAPALANTVIHELTHRTVFLRNEAEFNENLATFVGNLGGLEFLKNRYGVESPEYGLAIRRLEDEKKYEKWMRSLYGDLMRVYAKNLSHHEVLKAREIVFSRAEKKLEEDNPVFRNTPHIPLNNAVVLSHVSYHGRARQMEHLYDLTSRNLPQFISLMKRLRDGEEIPGDWKRHLPEVPRKSRGPGLFLILTLIVGFRMLYLRVPSLQREGAALKAPGIEKRGEEKTSGKATTAALFLVYMGTWLSASQGLLVGTSHSIAWTVAGFVLMISALVLRGIALSELGPQFSFAVRIRTEHRLITTGVYGVVRHPLHCAFFLELAGMTLLTLQSSQFLLLALTAVVIAIRNKEEDAALLAGFEDAFRE